MLRLAGAEVHYKIAVESEGSLPGANTICPTGGPYYEATVLTHGAPYMDTDKTFRTAA